MPKQRQMEKHLHEKNLNLVSVSLGSNESFSLIWFSFQNLSTSAHPPSFLSHSLHLLVHGFPFPCPLLLLWEKKNNPKQTKTPKLLFFFFCHSGSPELMLLFFLFVTFPKLRKFGSVPARKGKVIRQSPPTILLLCSRAGTTSGKTWEKSRGNNTPNFQTLSFQQNRYIFFIRKTQNNKKTPKKYPQTNKKRKKILLSICSIFSPNETFPSSRED